MKKIMKQTIPRSVVLFIVFALIAFVCRIIFKANLFDDTMLSARAVAGWNFVFLIFIFESTVFAFNRNCKASKQLFLDTYAKKQRFGKLQSVFFTADIYVEFLCIVLLSFILPLSFTYDCVGAALFGENYGRMQILLVILPILFVLEAFAHISVCSVWISENLRADAKNEKKNVSSIVRNMAVTAAAYCSASLVIPWMLPFVITVLNLGSDAVVFLYIPLALSAAVMIYIAAFYCRAIKNRKEFIVKLEKYCKEHSVTLSDIHKPYLSVFFQQKGIDFTLENNGNTYDCKLVAGIFPSSPIVFSDEGRGIKQDTIRLFKADIFYINTLIDYKMESSPEGNRKIVIALPVPKKIYMSEAGSLPRPADTGESVGKYTIYTATGFLNALDRNVLN